MKHGIKLVGKNRAQFKLSAELPPLVELDDKSKKILHEASLSWLETTHGKAVDNVQVPLPQLAEDRYVYKGFRALSQVFLSNRGIDFSRPGVLEAAVPLLNGKTIYANHDFRDIDNWRGVIAASWWDGEGKNSGGVPGINCQTMIDAYLNYRTACGVMMNPPAINACSVTVLSEAEFSHLDLVKNGTFWDYFLEEVNGETVRLIATKILNFWEMSFVFMGEDGLATGLPDDEENTEEENLGKSRKKESMSASEPIQIAAEKKTMNLTKEQKEKLGISLEADDVPESAVLDAALQIADRAPMTATQIAELSLKATQGEKLIAEKRAEVKRLATLAELGTEEGALNDVLTKTIDKADADDLQSLEKMYREKVGARFGNGRSSAEDAADIHKAGGVDASKNKALPAVKVL